MSLTLYAHPFSSYCQKVLIALYENGTPFTYRSLVPEDPVAFEELRELWPIAKFPVLLDGGRAIPETSIIIEHLELFHPGRVPLLPRDLKDALEVRFMDRFFDNHVMEAMQPAVLEALRGQDGRPEVARKEAGERLDRSYAWLEEKLAGRIWAAGDNFSLADCAAAPALFYADWVHEIGPDFPVVKAYRSRLLQRASVARAVDEARPFRPLFPLGAPDRD
ncbi:glutathione S-transferase family protein [Enterovirga sp. CN4-39]|uniref:glutathione S-transferase family protein n=1 Tax=Enterovirga sp. CN4-39 TaxID=3400910 RepID=UPI003C0E3E15